MPVCTTLAPLPITEVKGWGVGQKRTVTAQGSSWQNTLIQQLNGALGCVLPVDAAVPES